MRKPGPKQLPRAERFWSKTERVGKCLLWTGPVNRKRGGYGYFYDDDQRLRRAPRIAWELAHDGPPPDDEVVRHTCDVPLCVEPDHLILGTQAQNLDDMTIRGRRNNESTPARRGEARYNAKLTDDVVREARERHAQGESFTALGYAYKVSRPCIARAIKGYGWAHVTA